MTKRLIGAAMLLLMVFTTTAQDLLVTIPKTDSTLYRCYPIKTYTSFNLETRVKCNANGPFSVSVDKDMSFIGYSGWVSLNNTPITINTEQTAIFNLIVQPPMGTQDGKYNMAVNIEAYKNGSSVNVSSSGLFEVIVDNTPPTGITLAKSGASGSNSVTFEFDATDAMSKQYSDVNPNVGRKGIKQFSIALKDQQGITKATETCNGTESSWVKTVSNSNLLPGTAYNAYVTATDLAGNSATSEGLSVTTAPAAPTGLAATGVEYFSAMLSWDAMQGATSYEVYNVTSGSTRIGTTTSPSFALTDLQVGSTNLFAVKSVSSAGSSGLCGAISVKTPMPYINGSSSVCYQEVFSITNFLPGATAQWNVSGSLTLVSGQGSGSALIAKSSNGMGLVSAVVTYQGKSIPLSTLSVSVGIPLRPYISNGSVTKTTSSVSYNLTYGSPTTSLQLFFIKQPDSADASWIAEKNSGSSCFNLVDNGNFVYVNPTSVGTGSFTVQGENECGMSSYTTVYLTIRSSGGGIIDPPSLPIEFSIFPNPSSDQVTVTLTGKEKLLGTTSSLSSETTCEVQLWSSMGIVKSVKTRGKSVQLSLGSLPTGTYYIKVICKDRVGSQLFFKR
ncbi:MAG: hypothetical protein PHD00_07125 [Bacteroidales bacterium]|nr:hypothetical protein [Bacteroidales bacterium]MDD4672956.1 hypothetical protein [Bacteroidales bacterium]MDY0349518.1 T9SS type A sorting domain-containing protein [Tenuifilaceae bacterium]